MTTTRGAGSGTWAAQVRAVAGHELAALARDRRVQIGVSVVALLVVAAVASGALYYRRTAGERRDAEVIERARWDGQPAKDSHDATHYGLYVFKPLSPLALVDRGIESFVGVGLWLEAHRTNMVRHRPIEDSTSVSRFGELTAALSLQVLLPLLAIVAGHALVAGERDRGTWRQLLLSGTPPRTLVAGKVAALLAGLAAVGAPLAVLAAAGLFAGGAAPPWSRAAVMVAAYAAYLAGWSLIVVAVSAWARSSRTALVVLVGLWFAGVVVGPRVVGDLAARALPVPSHVAFRRAIEADIGPHSAERIAGIKARILREYGVSRTEDLPIDWRGISLQEEEERTAAVFARHFAHVFDQYDAQNAVLQAAGLVVPVLAVQAVSQAAAGIDVAHHRRFLEAAEAHRLAIQRLMNADITAHAREGTDYKADPSLWRTVPRFVHEAAPLGEAIGAARVAVLSLTVWLALGLGLCAVAAVGVRP